MENYTVFVKLMLQNELSKGLLLASGQFSRLNKEAEIFQARLNSIKTMGLIGGGLLFGGILGLGLLDKALKPAEDYAHQLNIMNMAGVTQKEIAQAIGAAWKNTHNVMTSSVNDNLRSLMDMRNVLGSMDLAIDELPIFTKMQAVLMSSTEGRTLATSKNFAQDFAFSVAKSIDIIGKVKTREEFEHQAVEMSKVITAFQGRVTPRMFQSVFAYARQAKFDMDDQFKYRFLPTLMLEYSQSSQGAGGGSRGVGPMLAATYRFTNQGFVNKKSLPELESLGLVHQKSALSTTTSSTTTDALTGHELAAVNPFLWTQNVLLPALKKKYGENISESEIRFHINQLVRGNQLAASLLTEFATKATNFWRDAVILGKALPVGPAFDKAMIADPTLAHLSVAKQWETVQVALTVPLVKILIPALIIVAAKLNDFSQVLIKYPALAKTLTYSFLALSASMAFGGTVLLLGAGFRLLWGILRFIPPLLLVTTTAFRGMLISLLTISAPIVGVVAAFSLLAFGAYRLSQVLGINWGALFGSLTNAIVNFANNISKAFNGLANGITNDGKSHFLVNSSDIAKKGGSQSVQVKSSFFVDGKKLADGVTHHQVNSANSIPNNTSRYDTGMSPTPVLMKMGNY